MSKYYRTVVFGHLNERLVLRGRLEKDETTNTARILDKASEEGRAIETIATPVRQLDSATLVEIELVTGRTHQIRAHLSSINHPVIGDSKYARTKNARMFNHTIFEECGLSTQLLHSYRLEFHDCDEPLSYLEGKVFRAPLPEQFENIVRKLNG